MSDYNINSKEYWNKRFKTDWDDFGGIQQTEFFAKLACDLFPEWFIRDIKMKQYSFCDMGCALGNGVDIISKFLGIKVSGKDFSEEAIEMAKELYPNYEFEQEDITNLRSDNQYDVIFCSNVLEHFSDPWKIAQNLANISMHYLVLLVPFREKLIIDEHVYKFDSNLIPLKIDKFNLIYSNSINGEKISNTYYPDQQILLIYSNREEDHKITSLKDVSDGISKSDLIKLEIEKNQEISQLKEDKKLLVNQIEEYKNEINSIHLEYENKLETVNNEVKSLVVINDNQKNLIMDYSGKQSRIDEKIIEDEEIIEKLQKELSKVLENKEYLQSEINKLTNLLNEKDNIINKAYMQTRNMTFSTLFKVTHFLNRFVYQGIKGDKSERKKFRKWLFSHLQGGGDADRRYNPLYSIINILATTNDLISIESIVSSEEKLHVEDKKLTNNQIEILNQNYTKYDIIIFSVIDYDFRYQRPQHFAASFAKNGHRVFYINANYHQGNSLKQINENLYLINLSNDMASAIYETDWLSNIDKLKEQIDNLLYEYCIRDAITIVDYPNWIHAAEYLREKYGFKIVTDYMDDFTGFLNPAEKLIKKNCINLLKSSDIVIPSSQFLYDIAIKYNENVEIVRNGTEFKHFNNAIRYNSKKDKKVIGYYGAVAHWFDIDKVIYVAKNMPDCEIVIIGEVSSGEGQLKKYNNIKLLGEMAYTDLPEHLSYFDVCMIPFDTSTDLIKATNPVKFYEYLSAGKKIVATEIPELEPYKDKYVYMSNDNDMFLNYIKLCLDGEDNLADFDDCIKFGLANDWQVRYEVFEELCRSIVPKISIIVLTYNNLKLNKFCIDSILNKTAYPRYELVIVDNQSTDGTKEYLEELSKKNYSNVKIIFNDQNLGFAGGNNVGIKTCDGDYVLTLNNDTIVTRGWLTSLVKHPENNKEIGMCGPVTNAIGNEAKIAVNYHNIRTLHEFSYNYTWEHMNEQYCEPRVLALFCTLIKRDVIKKCGLLDERYRVGMFEDDDYAEAAKRAGYKLTIADDAFIHHFDGASFKKLKDEKYRNLFEKNKDKFEKKWNIKWKMHKYRKGVNWDTNIDINLLNSDDK